MTKNEILPRFELALERKNPLSLKYGAAKIDLYVSDPGGRTHYTVCWYDGAKRQRFGTTRPDSAFEKIKALVGAAEIGRETASKISYERVQEYAQLDTELAGVNLTELLSLYKAHLAERTASLEEVCRLFVEAARETSQRHRETLRHHTRRLCKAFPGAAIASLKVGALDSYLSTYANPKTRINHRGTLCSLFAFAQRKDFLPAGISEAKKTERPKSKNVEPCVVASHDIKKLLDECTDKKIVAFLTIAAFAGCRAAEITRMKWRHIKDDCIVLPPEVTKTNRRRVAEMCQSLAAWLAPLRGEPDEPVSYEQTHKLYRRTCALFRKVGLPRDQNALRHTFVSCHMELHCDPSATSKTSGNSLAVLEKHYLKLVSKEDAEAWFNIFPPEDKTYIPVVERPPRPYPPGKKTWRAICAARNAAVKAALQTETTNQPEKHAKPTK